MKIIGKIIFESLAQAIQQLIANKLRSFLSLLGISIGIFCIIGVQSAVDSMQSNIRSSLNKLGEDVIYIQKFPWNEDPHDNFWKYMRRPNPGYRDYEAIKEKSKSASYVDYHTFVGRKTVKYQSSSVEGAFVIAGTYDHAAIFNIEMDQGRFYTPEEYRLALNKVLIGHKVAEELFGAIEPLGKEINLMGRKMEVIGVIKKSGKDLLQVLNWDECVVMSYPLVRKIAGIRKDNPWGGTIAVKAAVSSSADQLKGELINILRAQRKLSPKEQDNFSLNQLSVISNMLNQVFGVFDLLGLIIGIFAIIVGGFGVANIMFVSVKERTSIIGIKKAIGAKRWVILLEILVESIILCAIGGGIGMLLIFLATLALSPLLPFPIFLSAGNIINGLFWSIGIGIVAGLLPAMQASRLDPVEAIRS
jgi:putative ABC transport system permease protein